MSALRQPHGCDGKNSSGGGGGGGGGDDNDDDGNGETYMFRLIPHHRQFLSLLSEAVF